MSNKKIVFALVVVCASLAGMTADGKSTSYTATEQYVDNKVSNAIETVVGTLTIATNTLDEIIQTNIVTSIASATSEVVRVVEKEISEVTNITESLYQDYFTATNLHNVSRLITYTNISETVWGATPLIPVLNPIRYLIWDEKGCRWVVNSSPSTEVVFGYAIPYAGKYALEITIKNEQTGISEGTLTRHTGAAKFSDFGDLADRVQYRLPYPTNAIPSSVIADSPWMTPNHIGDVSISGDIRATTALIGHDITPIGTAFGNGSIFAGHNIVADGSDSLVIGQHLVSANAYSITLGYNVENLAGNTFVWSGVAEYGKNYQVTEPGTFSINPVDGIAGFYIGETNLATILEKNFSTNIYNFEERLISGDIIVQTAIDAGSAGAAARADVAYALMGSEEQRSADAIFAQIDSKNENRTIPLFIIDLNPSESRYWEHIELKGTTNNYATAQENMLYFMATTTNEDPNDILFIHDWCRLFILSKRADSDIRRWVRIKNTGDLDGYAPLALAIIIDPSSVMLRRDQGTEWLSENNKELIWSYVRIGHETTETDQDGNQTWRPVMPIKWYAEMPEWAKQENAPIDISDITPYEPTGEPLYEYSPLAGRKYDFSNNESFYTAVRDIVMAMGGTVTNFPSEFNTYVRSAQTNLYYKVQAVRDQNDNLTLEIDNIGVSR